MADSSGRRATRDGLVTVGLPTYNRRVALARATRSVMCQGYRPLRLVVSDNSSDDGTAQDLELLAFAHDEVSVHTNASNIGPAANFERVREEASGEFFMWLGDDDWLDDSYIDECVQELSSDPDTVLVAGACRYHDEDHDWRESPLIDLPHEDGRERVLGYFRSVRANGVFYGIVRRSVLSTLPSVPNLMGGDWLHLSRLAFLGKIRTLDHVEVHRSVGGATRSLAHVARHQGLGRISRNAPQIALAWAALADIGWRSRVYVPLGRGARLRLGVHAAGIILRRFLPGAVGKFLRIQTDRVASRIPTRAGDRQRAATS